MGDGGKGDTPRPVDAGRWAVGYVRTFVYPREVDRARASGGWRAAVQWLADNVPEHVRAAAEARAADPYDWMEPYWMESGRDRDVVNRLAEFRLDVDNVRHVYPALLTAAADVLA